VFSVSRPSAAWALRLLARTRVPDLLGPHARLFAREDKCLYTRGVRFEWDPRKAEANLRTHGVSFAEAVTVLEDDFALTPRGSRRFQRTAVRDPRHEQPGEPARRGVRVPGVGHHPRNLGVDRE
jgi:Ribonuclease toxin, BrnT, of type II toxin-antitoxin system